MLILKWGVSMIKEYKDERINELIKKSFERAIKDDEWSIRYLSEWNLLYECIDKILEYVESNYTKDIYVNRNMWWVLQETFFDILDLYDLDIKASAKITEREKLIKRRKLTEYQKTYLKNVCNFLNNTKGYINDYEVRELITLVNCEVCEESVFNKNVWKSDIEELSRYVENDMQDEFIEKICELS